MEQIFLLTDKNYEEIELCRPLLDRVVNEACHGEFTTDDLKDMLQRGTAWGAYVVSDGKATIS